MAEAVAVEETAKAEAAMTPGEIAAHWDKYWDRRFSAEDKRSTQ